MSEIENTDSMGEGKKILIVDDEAGIRDLLAPFLERAGYEIATAADGLQALEKVKSFRPDLLILDVLMPELNGREVLRQLREQENWTPVILLTQVGDAPERAQALEEGADDYLNKPFDSNELMARIKAVLRRARKDQPPLAAARHLRCGELVMDRTSNRVWFADEELTLTRKATLLLEYMMTHPLEVISRSRLLDEVWGWDYAIGERAVDTRISELRSAFGVDARNPKFIETIPGEGYRFFGEVDTGL
ncbi:MAG: response regulator transcription factor [Anaerolineales bacterium]|jgi:DNA-binding response OmpR family regulator